MSDEAAARDEAERHQAAMVERAAAQLTALSARLDALEGRFEGASATYSGLAGRIEDLTAAVARLGRLEASLAAMRTEAATAVDERTAGWSAELASQRRDQERAAAQSARATAELSARLDHAEVQLGGIDLAGRDSVLNREIAVVAAKLNDLEGRAAELERRGPRVEPVTMARIDKLQEQIEEVSERVQTWQARIDEQAARVRAAELSAVKQSEEAALLLEAHHGTVEAQRLAEGRVEAALHESTAAAEERWSAFRAERQHDWTQIRAAVVRLEDALHRAEDAIVSTDARVDGVAIEQTSDSAARVAEIHELRDTVIGALSRLRSAVDEAVDVVETGLPYERRPEVVEERQLAIRRALRARRPAQP